MEGEIKPFSHILNLCDGDQEFFMEICSDFFELFTEAMFKQLEEDIENKEGERIIKTAHKLRGAVDNFNLCSLSQHLWTLEKMGKEDFYDEAFIYVDKIKKELSDFKKEVELYLIQKNVDGYK